MRKRAWAVIALAAFVAGSLGWASDAQADDFRSVVREEVQAYLSAQQSDDGGDNTFRVYWKDGLRMETQDGKVKLGLGGTVMFDTTLFSANDYQNALGGTGFGSEGEKILSGFELRRVALRNMGQIGKHVRFALEVDFGAGGKNDVDFRILDAYVDIVNLRDCFFCGAPNLRGGHFWAPFGLEAQTRLEFLTFMERSLATQVFAPGRLLGVMLHDKWIGEQLCFSAGFFADDTRDGQDGVWENPHLADGNNFPPPGATFQGDTMSEGWGIAARIAWTPWYDCDCRCNRWDIGASVWHRSDLDAVNYRGKPNNLMQHYPVNTGNLAVRESTHVGFETAVSWGPWSLQGEYMFAMPDLPGDPNLFGWYAQLSYWLTGECRNWTPCSWGRVRPCCDFLENDCCCWGGWEIAFRASQVDLNDASVNGGEAIDFVLGINWHLNPNARIMLNAGITDVDSVGLGNNEARVIDESFFYFGIRMQVDW